jgi:signal transduction histidine kinase
VEVEDDAQPKPLNNEGRVLLFRAVRELLFNVLKHAQTSRARVRLHRDGDHVRLAVEDNGVGFAPDRLCASSAKIEGFGLFSIRERLNYFHGRMEINSVPGQGTTVILTIPLSSKKKKGGNLSTKPLIAVQSTSPPAVSKTSRPPAKTQSHLIRCGSTVTRKGFQDQK